MEIQEKWWRKKNTVRGIRKKKNMEEREKKTDDISEH